MVVFTWIVWMCSYLWIVNESMNPYYVNKDRNEFIIVNVFYEACYEKFAKDYV